MQHGFLAMLAAFGWIVMLASLHLGWMDDECQIRASGRPFAWQNKARFGIRP
jgi:hypothetical protein